MLLKFSSALSSGIVSRHTINRTAQNITKVCAGVDLRSTTLHTLPSAYPLLSFGVVHPVHLPRILILIFVSAAIMLRRPPLSGSKV
jgi:hypothetical protein